MSSRCFHAPYRFWRGSSAGLDTPSLYPLKCIPPYYYIIITFFCNHDYLFVQRVFSRGLSRSNKHRRAASKRIPPFTTSHIMSIIQVIQLVPRTCTRRRLHNPVCLYSGFQNASSMRAWVSPRCPNLHPFFPFALGPRCSSSTPAFPDGQVPVLEIDGYPLPQSHAITLYVGRIGGES